MIRLLFSHKKERIELLDKGKLVEVYQGTCDVKNELNKRRALHVPGAVVNSMPIGLDEDPKPYMPRRFPIGNWLITEVVRSHAKLFAPYIIRTDAYQKVRIWDLDENGGYDHPLDEWQTDGHYHLHYDELYTTSLGCIRIGSYGEAADLGYKLLLALKESIVYLEVAE